MSKRPRLKTQKAPVMTPTVSASEQPPLLERFVSHPAGTNKVRNLKHSDKGGVLRF